jgi:hypothetical protein
MPLLNPRLNVKKIFSPGTMHFLTEGMENIIYLLPRPLPLAHQGAMPAIEIAVQSGQVRNNSGPEWVQVDIANQLL